MNELPKYKKVMVEGIGEKWALLNEDRRSRDIKDGLRDQASNFKDIGKQLANLSRSDLDPDLVEELDDIATDLDDMLYNLEMEVRNLQKWRDAYHGD